jgi:AGZA family xanthine/uracil permease-like MFS transporter
VFIIDNKMKLAAAYAAAGAVLTYFGFIHGAAIGVGDGLGVSPGIALGYLLMAGMLYLMQYAPKSTGPGASG